MLSASGWECRAHSANNGSTAYSYEGTRVARFDVRSECAQLLQGFSRVYEEVVEGSGYVGKDGRDGKCRFTFICNPFRTIKFI